MDLGGEFSRGGDDEGVDEAFLMRSTPHQDLEHRHHKSNGLPTPSGRLDTDILVGEEERDGRALYGGGAGELEGSTEGIEY